MTKHVLQESFEVHTSEFMGIAGFAILHAIETNRKAGVHRSHIELCKRLHIQPNQLVLMDQVHGTKIQVVTRRNGGSGFFGSGKIISKTDGVMTQERNLCLAVSTADCVPVLFYDPVTQSIGALHAGFLGISRGITRKAISFMKSKFGSQPKDIRVYLGPSICRRCYSVSHDDTRVRALSPQIRTACVTRLKKDTHVDLRKIIRLQLISEKLKPSHIFQSKDCTFHTEKYPSHRREGKQRSKTIILVIKMSEMKQP